MLATDMINTLPGRLILLVAGFLAVVMIADYLEDRKHHNEDAPLCWRRAALLEFSFGCFLVIFSAGSYLAMNRTGTNLYLHISLALLGILWVHFSRLLLRGMNVIRSIFLFLSIFRLVTIVGIPFSLASIYYLHKCKRDNKRALPPLPGVEQSPP